MLSRIVHSVRWLVFAAIPLLLACGSAAATPTPVPQPQVLLAVSELVAGEENRLAFAVLDEKNRAIREPEVDITLFSLEGEEQTFILRGQGKAVFRPWPAGPGGVYTHQITFPMPGTWALQVEVPSEEGHRLAQSIPFPVRETSTVPALGAAVPRSVNKTARDVADLAELTTASPPDPDLYQLTITEAVEAGKPLVVSFATPLFLHHRHLRTSSGGHLAAQGRVPGPGQLHPCGDLR